MYAKPTFPNKLNTIHKNWLFKSSLTSLLLSNSQPFVVSFLVKQRKMWTGTKLVESYFMSMVKEGIYLEEGSLGIIPLKTWSLSDRGTTYTCNTKIILFGTHEIFSGKLKLHRCTVENYAFNCVPGDRFFGYWHLKMLAFA